MASPRDFETLVLPHLHAAYNLARWLVRDEHAAQDLVQDACLRAFRYFDALRGNDARPWLLGIVRNNCYTWLEAQRTRPDALGLDELLADSPLLTDVSPGADPLRQVENAHAQTQVNAAIRALAPSLREVIVLREIEGLAYAEIALIVAIPIGTVMSRLARARSELRERLGTLLEGR